MSDNRELIAAQTHHNIRTMLVEGGSVLRRLPSCITFMLGKNAWNAPLWRRFVRAVDGKVFQNATVEEWLTAEPWKGLGIELPTLRAILKENEAEGPGVIKLLAEHGCVLDNAVAGKQVEETEPTGPHGGVRKGAGRGRKGEIQVYDVNLKSKGGNRPAYLAGRLKRDHPEIAARVEAGEFRSVRAAAREAGIVKPPDPLKQLRRWWRAASPDQRAAFKSEMDDLD